MGKASSCVGCPGRVEGYRLCRFWPKVVLANWSALVMRFGSTCLPLAQARYSG